jgi:hypothetical protein
MKATKLLATLVLCAAPALLKAQVGQPRNDFAVGVNGGYLINRVSFNPTIKQNWKGGETFGISLRYTCEKYFSAVCAVVAEVNYANMGWKELIETSDETYSRDVRYVQVPLFARLGWGRERRGAQFFFQVGPQLNYCIGEKAHLGGDWTVDNPGRRPNGIVEQYTLDVENKFEYGIVAGLGVELSTRAGHFLLDGRYFYGLSDMFHNGKKDPFGRSANGAIQLKLSYLFDIIRTKGEIR